MRDQTDFFLANWSGVCLQVPINEVSLKSQSASLFKDSFNWPINKDIESWIVQEREAGSPFFGPMKRNDRPAFGSLNPASINSREV